MHDLLKTNDDLGPVIQKVNSSYSVDKSAIQCIIGFYIAMFKFYKGLSLTRDITLEQDLHALTTHISKG